MIMLNLTKKEMTELWLRLTRLEPLRADCRVTRSFGVDLEAIAAIEMRRWYLDLLASGPAEWLPVSDCADRAVLAVSDEGTLTVTVPEDCVRVLSLELYGWERPAEIVQPGSRAARMQYNPFSAGGVAAPVAVLRPGGRTLEIHSPAAGAKSARLRSLEAVTDPGEEHYIFHEQALNTIKQIEQ